MKKIRIRRLLTLIAVIGISTMIALAEKKNAGTIVRIEYEEMGDGGIKVTDVWNNESNRIDLKINGKEIQVKAGGHVVLDMYTKKTVTYYSVATGTEPRLWSLRPQKVQEKEEATANNVETKEEKVSADGKKNNQGEINPAERKPNRPLAGRSISYVDLLNQDDFFGPESVTAYTQKVEALCRSIDSSTDKSQFIIDNEVALFLETSEKELADKRANLTTIAESIASSSNVDASSQTMTLIVETLNNRLKAREDAYNKLYTLVTNVNGSNSIPQSIGERIANYGIVGAVILLLIILTIVIVRRKKKKKNTTKTSSSNSVAVPEQSSENPAIVVRRRTTSILKKQCIDDVIDNPAYLVIDSSDFTPDSAVRKIYIMNSCIKDVYNLYAEDLRNTDNPKEDGCMVLGRWVHDETNHTYDISLEEVVFPGDDAVFKEYELNFGGKIKLRIAEKLRKLRRDTNLQYDLVCWIHSHPGLGVFFSNSDDNVQMQLKHSQHPNFLIAFVVDILTSDQEMGIFTFRKDGSMNSKGDITKMYSLEEMYKWALQSERSSFNHDNYYNILENAKVKLPSCKGVELNNSSIIDLTQIVIEPETGIVGWAVGTTVENKSGQEFAVSSIVRNGEKPGTGIIGSLISMTHMSFPTIQRLIARDSVNLSFVMVYSSKQMSLTTIPVVNGELLPDEQFYGDVNIDDLKIWTRRKR